MSHRDFTIVVIRFLGFYLLIIALQNAWSLFEASLTYYAGLPALMEQISSVFYVFYLRMIKESVQMGVPAIFGAFMIVRGSLFYELLESLLTYE